MPCFVVDVTASNWISAVTKKPVYGFSHQAGHIMAALFSAGRTELADKKFIAFHISGGTSEMLLVTPDKDRIFGVEIIGETLDLN